MVQTANVRRGRPPKPQTASLSADTAPVEELASPRALEMRRERRRREPGTVDTTARLKLVVPPAIQKQLDEQGMTARWALDSGGRVQQLQAEEWDIVPGVDPVSASRSDDSQLRLMAKRKDWYVEDRAPLAELNKANERRAARGDAPSDEDGAVSTEQTYTPRHTQNRITRGT